jgi:hypothetical protein
MKTKIGPRMDDLMSLLDSTGGVAPSMMWLAERVGPHGSLRYGYQIVHRCIRAGLIRIDPEHEARSAHSSGAVVKEDDDMGMEESLAREAEERGF